MKKLSLVALMAFAATAALAQAPAAVTSGGGRTAQEGNAINSGGAPAAKAEMKTEAKKDASATPVATAPMATAQMSGSPAKMSARMKAMDTNGDGMISAKEWNDYHGGMWKKMKLKNGMAPVADVDAMLKDGPN